MIFDITTVAEMQLALELAKIYIFDARFGLAVPFWPKRCVEVWPETLDPTFGLFSLHAHTGFLLETKSDQLSRKCDIFPLALALCSAVSALWAGRRNKRERWQAQKYRADAGAIHEPPFNAAG